MADEIDFENGRISNFQHHMTLTVTLDQAIWHTVVDHSLNFIQIFVDRQTDGRTYVRTHRHRGQLY